MGMIYSSKKFETYMFDDSVAEENSRWRSALLRKKESRCGGSGADNYSFLESFAIGEGSGEKKTRSEIVHEVDERVNERINRSDAALQSSSSNYNSKTLSQSKCPDYLTSHKAAADSKDSDRNKWVHSVKNELVSIISDEDVDESSTMSSSDLADTEGLSGEQVLENEIASHDEESSVVVCPNYVTYGRSCYSKAQLSFFCSFIKLDVSEEGAKGCLSFEWKTLNLVSIESRWLDSLVTAELSLRIKSEPGQKSGILEVKCTLTDPCWSNTQDLIKSLDERYKEKWDVDLDSYELFEDTKYLQGDCDSIAISERDFQLLHPETFINDTIVDFYIEYLKTIKPADARVHFFNSFFFRKLADFDENQSRSVESKEAFQRVRNWTKKVNIFQKDYIFIPVNFRLHWSLIVICHPGEVVHFTDDEMEISLKVPCILHMDSIKGSHRGVEQCIKCYLWEEWKERNNHASEDISTKFMDLRFICLEVPQQENSYDCGLFMLHYMELFVKQASNNFNPLNNFINTDWFYPMEASLKRARIKRLIFELTKSTDKDEPTSSYELKNEADEEEEADVQILHETCNYKETCECIFDTCVNKSTDLTPSMVKPLKSEDMDPNLSDSDISGGSLTAINEQKNHGQMVLYDEVTDPNLLDNDINGGSLAVNNEQKNHRQMVLYGHSVGITSPIKKLDETEDLVGKQIVTVPEPNKINPNVTCINKSMNLLLLKDKSGGDDDEVFESHVVEDSDDDDDVLETCVVEDSGSDDSGDFYICDINNNCQKASVFKDIVEIGSTSKGRQRRHVVSVARKRPRRSS